MTKISLLKSKILRTHLASERFTVNSLESTLNVLQEWHENLPPEMYLSNLARQDLPDQDRRAIFYAHLLYLGAMILIYRRIASQIYQTARLGTAGSRKVADEKQEKALLAHAEKAILAAKYSARILGLLLAERAIMKRCWLIM